MEELIIAFLEWRKEHPEEFEEFAEEHWFLF